MKTASPHPLRMFLAAAMLTVASFAGRAEPPPPPAGSLWAQKNRFAWCVVPFDARHRSPEARAAMLQGLGFDSFAYDWRDKDIPTFDAEIDALQRHHIRLLAWWYPMDPGDPLAKSILETFRRHGVHPELWVMQSLSHMPSTIAGWKPLLPPGLLPPGTRFPQTERELQALPGADRDRIRQAIADAAVRMQRESLTHGAAEQARRVNAEADRIAALQRLARPYGCQVELYNHNGWFGLEANQLAIIARLAQLGISDVGMVYNFSHARDALHDDTKDFPRIWSAIKDHVVAVNITGIGPHGEEVYPSQGDCELDMMRTIQSSGWRGPVGVVAEMGGDARVTLRNYLIGMNWIAAELKQPGSGGPRPFPPVR